MEIVVTDDGSKDETLDVVREFALTVAFPVRFTTHHHTQFHLARCRNEGVRASSSPYLIFLDGDLLVPNNFVQLHLCHRRPRTTFVGDSCWLDRAISERIGPESIRSCTVVDWTTRNEQRRLRWKAIRAMIYGTLHLRNRPRLKGGNVAVWREDYERVNGYDEDFVGWGLEDTDFQRRLQQHGVRFKSSIGWTRTYHLWHPRDPSFVPRARATNNESLLRQTSRPSQCKNGLRQSTDFVLMDWSDRSETKRKRSMTNQYDSDLKHSASQHIRVLSESLRTSKGVSAMSLDNLFDRVICINLHDRTDRWTQFCNRIDKIDWPFRQPERFRAINGKICMPPDWMRNRYRECEGAWGCYQSHVRILEDALLDNVAKLLILEDDAVFVSNFAHHVGTFLDEVTDEWDHLYFGGEHILTPNSVSAGVYRCRQVHRTHAHALSGEFIRQAYEYLISYPTIDQYGRRGLTGIWPRVKRVLRRPTSLFATSHMERSAHVDHHFGAMHRTDKFNVFAPTKWLVGQSAGVSDIMDEPVAEQFWKWKTTEKRSTAA